jgi:hypothetical protein
MKKPSVKRTVLLIGVALAVVLSPKSAHADARTVLERFCELDAQGKQLTPEGWKDISALFVSPGSQQGRTILVIKDFVVSKPAIIGSKAEFYVEYVVLGKIDATSARLFSFPPVKVRDGFDLVPTAESGDRASNNQAGQSVLDWKIDGKIPEPHLSVAAAIQFVSKLKNNATDSVFERNAERAILTLRYLATRP